MSYRVIILRKKASKIAPNASASPQSMEGRPDPTKLCDAAVARCIRWEIYDPPRTVPNPADATPGDAILLLQRIPPREAPSRSRSARFVPLDIVFRGDSGAGGAVGLLRRIFVFDLREVEREALLGYLAAAMSARLVRGHQHFGQLEDEIFLGLFARPANGDRRRGDMLAGAAGDEQIRRRAVGEFGELEVLHVRSARA